MQNINMRCKTPTPRSLSPVPESSFKNPNTYQIRFRSFLIVPLTRYENTIRQKKSHPIVYPIQLGSTAIRLSSITPMTLKYFFRTLMCPMSPHRTLPMKFFNIHNNRSPTRLIAASITSFRPSSVRTTFASSWFRTPVSRKLVRNRS